MNEWMNEWVSESMNGWMSEWKWAWSEAGIWKARGVSCLNLNVVVWRLDLTDSDFLTRYVVWLTFCLSKTGGIEPTYLLKHASLDKTLHAKFNPFQTRPKLFLLRYKECVVESFLPEIASTILKFKVHCTEYMGYCCATKPVVWSEGS